MYRLTAVRPYRLVLGGLARPVSLAKRDATGLPAAILPTERPSTNIPVKAVAAKRASANSKPMPSTAPGALGQALEVPPPVTLASRLATRHGTGLRPVVLPTVGLPSRGLLAAVRPATVFHVGRPDQGPVARGRGRPMTAVEGHDDEA